jgi:hypothetical protein
MTLQKEKKAVNKDHQMSLLKRNFIPYVTGLQVEERTGINLRSLTLTFVPGQALSNNFSSTALKNIKASTSEQFPNACQTLEPELKARKKRVEN